MGNDDIRPDEKLDHGIIHFAAGPSHGQLCRADPRIQWFVPSLVHELVEVVSKRHDFAIVGTEEGGAHVDELGKQLFEPLLLSLELSVQLAVFQSTREDLSVIQQTSVGEVRGQKTYRMEDSLVRSCRRLRCSCVRRFDNPAETMSRSEWSCVSRDRASRSEARSRRSEESAEEYCRLRSCNSARVRMSRTADESSSGRCRFSAARNKVQ